MKGEETTALVEISEEKLSMQREKDVSLTTRLLYRLTSVRKNVLQRRRSRQGIYRGNSRQSANTTWLGSNRNQKERRGSFGSCKV
ncbi:MAG: hypothetical protein WBD16_15185 [Pyrinomonadaceae bacterium]